MRVNGNLTLNANGLSEVQNLVVERVTSLPATQSSESGRIVYLTGDNKYYYQTGTGWASFATGGSASAIQAEVDAIEASLGAFVNGDGTFAATAFGGFSNVVSPSSLLNALSQMDSALAGKDTLAELDDVSVGGVTSGQYLKFNGTQWAADSLNLNDVSDVTATASEVNQLASAGAVNADFVKLHAVTASAAELNIMDGVTATTAEINYLGGADSNIQDQLDGKQPLDATLTGVAALTTATADSIMFTDDGAAFSYDSGAGARSKLGLVIGTDVQAYDADLTTVAGFAPAAGSLEGTKTVYDVMVATGTTEGARWVLQRGATARTSLGLGDVAVHDDAEYVRVDGTNTFTADQPMGGFQLTGLGAPVTNTNAATKLYVDTLVTGLTWKNAVKAATTENLAALSGEITVDTAPLVAGDRVLVKDQTLAEENGIYVVDAGAWVRAADMNDAAEFQNASVLVLAGTQAKTAWTETLAVATIGTDDVAFVQFNGAASLTAGIGLGMSGNTIDVNLGAGIAQLPTDEVGVDLFDSTTGALILTLDGSTRSVDSGSQIHLKTNLTQFVQDAANGLKLASGGVTETELATSVAGNGLVGAGGNPIAIESAAGTPGTVGTIVVTENAVGVALGNTTTTAAPGNHIHAAAVVTYDGTASTLAATDVQGAIDEVEARVDTLEGDSDNLQTEIDAIETAVGLDSDGNYVAPSGTTYLDATTSVAGAAVALDTAVADVAADLGIVDQRLGKCFFLYEATAAATVHTVTHNIGSKYCSVTVIDDTDEVVIPQSITFTSTAALQVTFNSAVQCRVVVVGLSTFAG